MIRLTSGPHLLIDDYLVASQSNMKRVINQPRKLPGPVITSKEDDCFQPFLSENCKHTGSLMCWHDSITPRLLLVVTRKEKHMKQTGSDGMGLVNKIIEYIRSENLSVGDPIPSTRELADKWGIGRNIVRQGLMQAQTLGLVKMLPRSGTFVQQPDFSVLVDALAGGLKTTLVDEGSNPSHLMEARSALEGDIAGLAAARRSDDYDLLVLQQAMDDVEKSTMAVTEGTQDRATFVEADEKYHMTVARLAANPVLEAMLQALLTLLRPQRIRMEHTKNDYMHTNSIHRNIYQGIMDGDVVKAREAMEEHLTDYRSQVVTHVARRAAGNRRP